MIAAMFRLGYNTNGLAHHRPADALRLVAGIGYEALALTPDPGCLDPYDLRPSELNDVRNWAEDLGLALVVETGSRFLLDAERKHFPTLLEESATDRARRLDFLKRCLDMAAVLDAEVLSIWSGASPAGGVADWPADERHPELGEEPWERLVEGVGQLVDFATGTGVQLAFEPEPGMFVATPVGYGELVERLGSRGDGLGLTLDVGHCLVTGDDVAQTIHTWAPRLVNVHLDDIADHLHDHRMFGEGELDLAATLRALVDVDFGGVAAVELSRHSHQGAEAAAQAMTHLRAALAR
jgi:sugar phosphate isomerase/epimerase